MWGTSGDGSSSWAPPGGRHIMKLAIGRVYLLGIVLPVGYELS